MQIGDLVKIDGHELGTILSFINPKAPHAWAVIWLVNKQREIQAPVSLLEVISE